MDYAYVAHSRKRLLITYIRMGRECPECGEAYEALLKVVRAAE